MPYYSWIWPSVHLKEPSAGKTIEKCSDAPWENDVHTLAPPGGLAPTIVHVESPQVAIGHTNIKRA